MKVLRLCALLLLTAASAPLYAAQTAPSALHIYDFKKLYAKLGYTPTYFNASRDAMMALESYTDEYEEFYTEINNYLRYYPAQYDWTGTSPADAKVYVKQIDGIIQKAPALPADMVLFRGMDFSYRQNRPFAAGEEFSDKAYVSTSASFKVAHDFATQDTKNPQAKRTILVIYQSGTHRKGLLYNQGEDEVILPHGSKFKAMAAAQKNGYILYLVQWCEATCENAAPLSARVFWQSFSSAIH